MVPITASKYHVPKKIAIRVIYFGIFEPLVIFGIGVRALYLENVRW